MPRERSTKWSADPLRQRYARSVRARWRGGLLLCAVVAVTITSSISIRAQFARQQPNTPGAIVAPDAPGNALALSRRTAASVQVTSTTLRGAGVPANAPAGATAAARALSFLQAHARSFGLRAAQDFVVRRTQGRDATGLEQVRLQQLSNGIPVTAGELILHLRGDRVVSARSEVVLGPAIDTLPTLEAADAVARATELMARQLAVRPATDAPTYSPPRLEVLNRGVLEEGSFPTRLAWFVEARAAGIRELIWVDAQTGAILLHFNQMARALNRRVHNADYGPALPGRVVRSEGAPATGDHDADSAYEYTGDTYRYFLREHARDSFDGTGGALISSVHACPAEEPCPWPQAGWNGEQMVYGEGFAVDDVTGHEMTHAITERTANLFYYMQSGALNESYSDIFGETVDLTNGRGIDGPAERWLIGEETPGGAIRSMANPGRFHQPARVTDPAWQHDPDPVTGDRGGVHTNSGVPNHAFALMVDGGRYNNRTIGPIGLAAAAKVHYRALTQYLTSGANLLDHYFALQQACRDLIGTSGITEATCVQVRTALDAVEMSLPVTNNAPIPQFCPIGQEESTIFSDDFEASPNQAWTTATRAGQGAWIVPDTGWAKSGTRMAWGEGFGTMTDAVMAMTDAVPIPTGARLQFNHAYAFEESDGMAYDGAVIEYSTNDGATWLDAGNLILGGDRYDPHARLASGSGNPLAGRAAFAGNSYGYTATQLNLASLAGQRARFRFRVATDEAVGHYGWVVDDVRVYSCSCRLSIDRTSASFDDNGGGGAVQVTGGASCPWTAASSAGWIRLSRTMGAGTGSVDYWVEANASAEPRSATLTVAGYTITITQAGRPDRARGGELRTYDAADRLRWEYEPHVVAAGTVEFTICQAPALTWRKALVLVSGNFILLDSEVKDRTKCTTRTLPINRITPRVEVKVYKAKFLGIATHVRTWPMSTFGAIHSGSRLTLHWLRD
jgi:bacillolysin